jgi:DNA repair ATPase RecN
VGKSVSKGRTATTVRVLDEAERTAELARMLGGAEPSREATAPAGQMLRRARDGREAGRRARAAQAAM